jgi:purine-binding chemotaxis protein CheW
MREGERDGGDESGGPDEGTTPAVEETSSPDEGTAEVTNERGDAGPTDGDTATSTAVSANGTVATSASSETNEPTERSQTGETASADTDTPTPAQSDSASHSDPAVADAGTESVQTAQTEAATETELEGAKAPLPDADQLETALADPATDPDTEPDESPEHDEHEQTEQAPTEDTADETATEAANEETRVLEFTLDDEHYCLDIQYIEEIVKQETITRVPNTPEFVEGVVDLRGQITTILNPKVTLEKDNDDPGELIVVFDGEAFEDQGYIGWIVDDVRQVSPITDSEVNDPPMGESYINGVVDRDDEEQFVIWTTPELALEEVE